MAKAEKTTLTGAGVASKAPPPASTDLGEVLSESRPKPATPTAKAAKVKNDSTRSSAKERGSLAALPADTHILIHARESFTTWVEKEIVTSVEIPGQPGRRSAVVDVEAIPMHFEQTPIEGCPEAAGGCSLIIDVKLAKRCDMTVEELVKHFRERDQYGLDMAFLDDRLALEPVLQRMHNQAVKYDRDFREAVAQGIMRSDAVLPEDRVLG